MKKILFSIITLMMVLVPLVNAEQKAEAPDDEKYYAKVSDGAVGGRLGATFGCTYSNDPKTAISAKCGTMTVKLVDKNENGRTPGYWYGVVLTMPAYDQIDLSQSTLKINGKDAGYVKDILDGTDSDSPRWAGIWQKVNEIKMAEKSEEDDSIEYTFEWYDKTDSKTYTQTLTVSLSYKDSTITTEKTDPSATNLYKVTVTVGDGGSAESEIIYINHEEKETLDKISSELEKFKAEKSGYKFKHFAAEGTLETKLDDNAPITDDMKIVAVFEKIPSSSGSTSTVTPDPEPTPELEDKPADKDNTPKTGNTDLIGIASMMVLLSLIGIVKLKKSM